MGSVLKAKVAVLFAIALAWMSSAQTSFKWLRSMDIQHGLKITTKSIALREGGASAGIFMLMRL